MKNGKKRNNKKFQLNDSQMQAAKVTLTLALVFSVSMVMAQSGEAGINAAESQVRGYFETGTKLMTTIGAVTGIIGAVKVYNKWNQGEPDTAKVAASWFGSCIFLVVVAQVLKGFFL